MLDDEFKDLVKSDMIEHVKSVPYHPSMNPTGLLRFLHPGEACQLGCPKIVLDHVHMYIFICLCTPQCLSTCTGGT